MSNLTNLTQKDQKRIEDFADKIFNKIKGEEFLVSNEEYLDYSSSIVKMNKEYEFVEKEFGEIRFLVVVQYYIDFSTLRCFYDFMKVFSVNGGTAQFDHFDEHDFIYKLINLDDKKFKEKFERFSRDLSEFSYTMPYRKEVEEKFSELLLSKVIDYFNIKEKV